MDWYPAAILPNLFATDAVEGDVIALVPSEDPRIGEFCRAHAIFKEVLGRFTNAFGEALRPVVQIVRSDVASKLTYAEIASFRDLVALSVVPYSRALTVLHGNQRRISYTDSFWLYTVRAHKRQSSSCLFNTGTPRNLRG